MACLARRLALVDNAAITAINFGCANRRLDDADGPLIVASSRASACVLVDLERGAPCREMSWRCSFRMPDTAHRRTFSDLPSEDISQTRTWSGWAGCNQLPGEHPLPSRPTWGFPAVCRTDDAAGVARLAVEHQQRTGPTNRRSGFALAPFSTPFSVHTYWVKGLRPGALETHADEGVGTDCRLRLSCWQHP